MIDFLAATSQQLKWLGGLFTWLGGATAIAGLLVATSSFLQNLERERRALAARLICDWATGSDWATSRAIAIAIDLSDDVRKAIVKKNAVSIDANYYESIVSILESSFTRERLPRHPDSEGRFIISSEHSAFIRFLWARWLNRLEGTLAAWQQGAADTELMEREFGPLVTGSEAELDALKTMREGLPIVNVFYVRMIKNKERGVMVRPPLGLFRWPFFRRTSDLV